MGWLHMEGCWYWLEPLTTCQVPGGEKLHGVPWQQLHVENSCCYVE